MSASQRPTRADYVAWRTATTRWADDDVFGHMNNAKYFELIDTAVNVHLAETTGLNIRSLPAIGVVAEVSCRYFREIGYPHPVDMGLMVERLGTSSVIYRIGLSRVGTVRQANRPQPRAVSCTSTSTTPTTHGPWFQSPTSSAPPSNLSFAPESASRRELTPGRARVGASCAKRAESRWGHRASGRVAPC